MSRDYKSHKTTKSANGKSGSAFFGGFIGYALGLASAIGVWLYLYFAPSPFVSTEKATSPGDKNQTHPEILITKEKPKSEESVNFTEEKSKFDFYKILPGIEEPELDSSYRQSVERPIQPQTTAKIPETASKPEIAQPSAPTRPTIIAVETPGQIATMQPQALPASPTQQVLTPQPKNAIATKEKFFLQAGSFKKSDEAENLKARLAFLGVFASIQPIDLADKGVWYRVRVGPFTRKEEVDETSASLRENGIATQFIKMP
ncbi:MAG: SPOR domain-containing protein [Nitrosomonas sp.]|nr:MAG: SPOR domain-containing protein [Nitrosomonas sp.]